MPPGVTRIFGQPSFVSVIIWVYASARRFKHYYIVVRIIIHAQVHIYTTVCSCMWPDLARGKNEQTWNTTPYRCIWIFVWADIAQFADKFASICIPNSYMTLWTNSTWDVQSTSCAGLDIALDIIFSHMVQTILELPIINLIYLRTI